MVDGLTAGLLCTAAVIGLGSVFIVHRIIGLSAALFVVGVKVAVPLVYFSWYYDGTWTHLDDLSYLQQGMVLLDAGYNPLTLFVKDGGLTMLISLSGGSHILYGWFNLFSQYIFGQYYYAPVFLNVLLTFISGWFLYRLAWVSGFRRTYCRWLTVFFLLHWDVLVWSSFVNLKDILILTLTIILLYCLVLISHSATLLRLAGVLLLIYVFFWVRFYVPVLALAAFAIYYFFVSHGGRMLKGGHFIALAITTVFVLWYLGVENLQVAFERLDTSPLSVFVGTIRMMLTPQPWSIDPQYSYLILTSVMHVIWFIPAIAGGFLLWQRSRQTRLLIIYLCIMIIMYGAFQELQGPRHRVQIVFIVAWMQFHFLWALLADCAKNIDTAKMNFRDRENLKFRAARRVLDNQQPLAGVTINYLQKGAKNAEAE